LSQYYSEACFISKIKIFMMPHRVTQNAIGEFANNAGR